MVMESVEVSLPAPAYFDSLVYSQFLKKKIKCFSLAVRNLSPMMICK